MSLGHWIVLFFCLVALVGIQMRAFGRGARLRQVDDVSSFFIIDDLIDRTQRRLLAFLSAIPLSFVFFIAAYYVDTFGTAIINFTLGELGSESLAALFSDADSLRQLIQYIPRELNPVLLLGLTFVVFGAHLIFVYRWIERTTIFVWGVRFKARRIVEEYARLLLDRLSYEEIVERLKSPTRRSIPLAEELDSQSDQMRLAFNLLHLTKFTTPKVGMKAALYEIAEQSFAEVETLGKFKESGTRGHDRARYATMAAAFVLYFAILGAYLVLIPLAEPFVAREFDIEWPSGHPYLTISMFEMSVGQIFPILCGLVFISKWRGKEITREVFIGRTLIIMAIVFSFSAVVYCAFTLANLLGVFAGTIGSDTGNVSFGQPELVYVLLHSLIACIVLLLATLMKQPASAFQSIMLLVLMVAAINGTVYFLYELSWPEMRGYYWHQSVLGFALSVTALSLMTVVERVSGSVDDGVSLAVAHGE